jgi:hypothetical protein
VDAIVEDSSVPEGRVVGKSGALGDDQPQRLRLGALDIIRAAAYVLAALAVSVPLRLRTPGIPGLDSYYHFRHADLYVRYGLWMKEFPWLVYSTINKFSGDIGYGFHVFLTPFTLLPDEVLGMKLASAVEAAIVLVALYLVLRRHRVRYAFAWPFYLLFLAPPITYTFIMTRPQTLTMGLMGLLLSFMVKGPAFGVLLSSFALAFFHLNAFPLVLMVVAVTALAKGVVESRWEWGKWLAGLAGIGVGWLLRPNPIGVAQLEYTQIVVHEAARHAQLPLLFGREWTPVAPAALSSFALPIVLWICATLYLFAATASPHFKVPANRRTFLWSAISLSALFFVLMVLITKRFTPFWATSAVMVTAAALSLLITPSDDGEYRLSGRGARSAAAAVMAALLGMLAWKGLAPDAAHVSWVSPANRSVQTAAEALRGNGIAGEVVYNVDWGMFPGLFFSNTEDYYVSGLDPIFLYAYDPQLYWKSHHLATGRAVERTYSSQHRNESTAVDTYAFVQEDLRASYIILDRRRYAELDAYLQSDPRFSSVLGEQHVALYAVQDVPQPGHSPSPPGTQETPQ